MLVNGQDTGKIITIKRDSNTQSDPSAAPAQAVSGEANAVATDMPTADATATATDPDTKFLGSFVTLQQSILDMRTWLAQSSYPTIIKTGLGIALDGVDQAVGKVSELVLLAEGQSAAPAVKTADIPASVPSSNRTDVTDGQVSNQTDRTDTTDSNADSAAESTAATTATATTNNTSTIDPASAGLTVNNGNQAGQ